MLTEAHGAVRSAILANVQTSNDRFADFDCSITEALSHGAKAGLKVLLEHVEDCRQNMSSDDLAAEIDALLREVER